MKKMSKNSLALVQGAMIAAMYAALTYLSGIFGMSYGSIQFRVSEALTILPVFTPAAIPGLAVGCFIGNLGSPYGIVDIICGTVATILAAITTRAVRNIKIKGIPILAPLMPVLFNAIIIGAEIAVILPKGTRWSGFLVFALQVGLGEIVVCYILGLLLYAGIKKIGENKIFKINNR